MALLSLCGLERVIGSIFLLRVGVCVSRCPHDGFASRECALILRLPFGLPFFAA